MYYLILQEEERNGDVKETHWAKDDETVHSKRVSPPPSKEEGKTVHLKRVFPPPSKEEVYMYYVIVITWYFFIENLKK